jgi:hypothetical protein
MINFITLNSKQEWLNYRNLGLGASEIATLLGYDNYKSCLELFHQKVGIKTFTYSNIKMQTGVVFETMIRDYRRAYNGNDEQLSNRYDLKIFDNIVEELPPFTYIINTEIPYLFVSPDSKLICPDKGIGSHEIKNTSSMYLNTFLDKIATPHKIQIKTQMMAWEVRYGILSYLIDATNYKEHEYYRDGIIFDDKKNGKVITEDDLKSEVNLFWQKVLMARELVQKIKIADSQYNFRDKEKYQAVLDELEPEADSTLAYESYLKDNYYSIARPCIEIQGTQEHEVLAENYLKAKENLKISKDFMQLQENKILGFCKSGHQINLGKNKSIKVDATSRGVAIKVKY